MDLIQHLAKMVRFRHEFYTKQCQDFNSQLKLHVNMYGPEYTDDYYILRQGALEKRMREALQKLYAAKSINEVLRIDGEWMRSATDFIEAMIMVNASAASQRKQ